MKRLELNISHSLRNILKKPIRTRNDISLLMLETVKQIISGYNFPDDSNGKIIINVDKMSRLIYIIDDKIFSINFPFVLVEDDDSYKLFINDYDIDINNLHINIVGRIFELNISSDRSSVHYEQEVLELIEFMDKENEMEVDFCWKLFKILQTFEPGYLRYDYDPKRENGMFHPLHHIDVYYSNKNTFKLGLDDKLTKDMFLDIIDINTECYIVSK